MARKITHRYDWLGNSGPQPTELDQELEQMEDELEDEQPVVASSGWFLAVIDVNGLGEPVLSEIYGPFASEHEAEDFGGYIYEPGNRLWISEGIAPGNIAQTNRKYDVID